MQRIFYYSLLTLFIGGSFMSCTATSLEEEEGLGIQATEGDKNVVIVEPDDD